MKTVLNLATSDLAESISFYSTLLNSKPARVRTDYALFITDEPGMELALDLRNAVKPITDAHYGIFVETTGEVERAIERLTSAGLVSSIEPEETCCYAKQTKVWAVDPDGRRWEIYTVREGAEERDAVEATCCASASEERACCVG